MSEPLEWTCKFHPLAMKYWNNCAWWWQTMGWKRRGSRAAFQVVLHVCIGSETTTHKHRERARGHLKFYCALSLQILITFFFPSRPQRNKIMAPPPPPQHAYSILTLPSKHTQSCYNNNNNYLLWQSALGIYSNLTACRREREKLHALQLFTAACWRVAPLGFEQGTCREERWEKSYCRIFASNELRERMKER